MNQRIYLTIALMLLAALLGAAALWHASLAPALAVEKGMELNSAAAPEIVSSAPPKYLGARSCAATACHGSAEPDTRPGRIGRNEYVYWFEHDPHARAFRALTAPRGQAMLARLGISIEGKIVDEAGYKNCLACHNLEPPERERGENFFATEGVGCEACHGAAERWIAEHHRGGFSAEQKQALGMKATDDLAVRAELCVRCHVGSPSADVNHDLLAAGHPPLKFELAAYCEIYPKHWNDREERRNTADFELQLWLKGKFATQRAALEVQAARADKANDKAHPGPWPEFANYDCFSCHHDLAGAPYWKSAAAPDKPLATWPAARWYFAGFDPSALLAGASVYVEQEARMRVALEQGLNPNSADVAAAARSALETWNLSAARWPTDSDGSRLRIRRYLATLAANEAALVGDWDTATQNYLLLAAYERAQRDEAERSGASGARFAERAAALTELRGKLAFPPEYDSPKQFVGPLKEVDSPRAEVREKFRKLLETLH